MAKIDLEAQAQAILNRERNGSKQFDVIVGNLMAMDSFLSTYKTLKSKGKLKGKKLEKVKALVEKVQAIRDHINDTIYKEQNRRNTIFRSTNEYQELETQFQEYDRIKNNPNVDTWRSSGDKYPADDPEDITELSDDDRRLVSHFRLIADSFGIPHSELCGKSLSDLEAFIDTKARRQQQLATTINKENGTLDKAVIDSDIAILADAKTAYEDYDRKKAAHDEYERKKAAHDEYERKKAAHDEYERKKAAYDAYERKKDAYDAYQHSNAYPALWNAQQIILDNPNHQDLFTLLPNSKEDIKKRLESYLEDPSISDTERAAIEMLIAENEFTQLPSLEEPEVPGPAPEEPGPEPEKPGAEPEKPGTEPEKPGASLSPDAVNQMIQVLQAQNIAMQHLTLT